MTPTRSKIASNMDSVFVIGYPRSGTTLLLHLLMSSGEFPTYRFNESHFFSHCYRRYGSLAREDNRRELVTELEARQWFSGTDVTVDQLLQRIGDERTHYEAYLGCFMDLVAESQSKTRWLEKTPWHLHYVEEIRSAFPKAKFLIMVRDPRDVILSIAKYGWIADRPARMLWAAIAWRWVMRLMQKQFADGRSDYLFVRYEDLVTDTARALGRINDFLGLRIDLATLNESKFGVMAGSNSSFGKSSPGIARTSIGRWRDTMPPDLVTQMNYLLGDTLAHYGYDADASNSPPAPSRAKLSAMSWCYRTAKRARRLLFPLVRR